ncbi:hypothetical protein ACUIJN_14605 [Metabacillus halosaccharovorans]|uniref:hypothetical protein n=1 Tax=Metabacillus halosaccharovorans TaxID=930124 RepID=UPI00403D8ED4
MLPSLWILIITTAIIVFEVPKLKKSFGKKEIWVFFILLFIGTGMGIAESNQIKLPNPLDWFSIVFKPLNEIIETLLS